MNGPFGRILSVEEFDAIGLTYSIPAGNIFVPLIPGKEHERVAYEDKDLFVSLAISKLMEMMTPTTRSSNFAFSPHPLIDDMPPSEKAFWDTVEAITNDPAKAVGLCFAIRVLGQDIFLKESGDNIGVTKENLKEYVDRLCQRQEMIHNAFVQNEIQTTEMGMVPTGHTPPTTATLMESLHQYPPQSSHLWNTFTLDPEDANNEIFHIVNATPSRKEEHMAGELEGSLSFAIPISGKGLYKLLPHGEKILVTRLNEKEFVERIWYEKKRLLCMASTPWKRHLTSAQPDATAVFEPADEVLPGCSHLPRIEAVESLRSQRQRINCDPSSGLMRVTTSATLDEIDMYKKNLMLLKQSRNRLSPRTFQDLGLRYALTVGGEELELVRDGRRQFVAMHELGSYVDMAVCKLEELRHHVLQRNEGYPYSLVVPFHHPPPQRKNLQPG
ncbi:hypothetical protein TRSC58_06961 [Trypanosoma rangeli SC58]|nr:hypothetical protein TRSC58_06961 [Trypanosoma rangeli SC58]